MPEIENQEPSDEELAAYLAEWLQTSSLTLLRDYPENRRYYHPEHVESLSYLSSLRYSSEFLETAKDMIFQALKRLNALPRTDSFWSNTNFRPTVTKLGEFCALSLRRQPADVLFLWTLAALRMVYAGDFNRECWTKLYQLRAVGFEIVAFAAMFHEMAGAPSGAEFSSFITETASTNEAVSILGEVREKGGKLLAEWSRLVASSL